MQTKIESKIERKIEKRKKKQAEMENWSLEKKIKHSKKRIKEFYEKVNGKVDISFSGGKDSVVLRHLVLSLYPDTPCVFCNTTNEYPEILAFIRTVPNVTWLEPKMTFIETLEQIGFPLISKKTARGISVLRNPTDKNESTRNLALTGFTRAGRYAPSYKLAKKWLFLKDEQFDITDKCCDILKKKPMLEYHKTHKTFSYVGTQASESQQRNMNWIKYGCNIFNDGISKSRPLSIWNENDVWAYIKLHNLPYSSIYDDVFDKETGELIVKGELRTGCAYCAYGANLEKEETNRFQRLQLRKPKQFEKMMNVKNNGVRFEDALHKVQVKTRIEDAN